MDEYTISTVYLHFNVTRFQSRASVAMLLGESPLSTSAEAGLWKKNSSFGLTAINLRNLAQGVQRTPSPKGCKTPST